MNLLKNLKEISNYNEIYSELKDLKNQEDIIISKICDHFEAMCKTDKYLEAVLTLFSRDTYDVYLSIAQMNIMIQCINKNDVMIGFEDEYNIEHCYKYERELFPEFEEFHETIENVFADDKESNCMGDIMFYTLLTTSCLQSENLYLNVIKEDIEYLNERNYRDIYLLNRKYDRAIIAVYNMYKRHSARFVEVMRNNLGGVEY